jgi:hypothetical protein
MSAQLTSFSHFGEELRRGAHILAAAMVPRAEIICALSGTIRGDCAHGRATCSEYLFWLSDCKDLGLRATGNYPSPAEPVSHQGELLEPPRTSRVARPGIVLGVLHVSCGGKSDRVEPDPIFDMGDGIKLVKAEMCWPEGSWYFLRDSAVPLVWSRRDGWVNYHQMKRADCNFRSVEEALEAWEKGGKAPYAS